MLLCPRFLGLKVGGWIGVETFPGSECCCWSPTLDDRRVLMEGSLLSGWEPSAVMLVLSGCCARVNRY
jgi:hypothetical protein